MTRKHQDDDDGQTLDPDAETPAPEEKVEMPAEEAAATQTDTPTSNDVGEQTGTKAG